MGDFIIVMLLEFDQAFLKKELKILPQQTDKWTSEEVTRLLALLKIPQALHGPILEESRTTSILKLTQKIDNILTDLNFFPYTKLKTVVAYLMELAEEDSSFQSLLNENFPKAWREIKIPQENVMALKAKVDGLSDMLIIELSCLQIVNLLRQSGLEREAAMIKKYSIDGFSLVCSLADAEIVRNIMNYFQMDDIRMMEELSVLFAAHYLRQLRDREIIATLKKEVSQTSNTSEGTIDSRFISKGGELIIECSERTKKSSEDEIDIDNSEEDLGQSVMGSSHMDESQMGVSEIAQSEYPASERGSVYADSVYDFDNRGSVDCRLSFKHFNQDNRSSLMYDDDIIHELKSSCLFLPFDLLNLEPLQIIKLRSMATPFAREVGTEHWQIRVQGVKFGRDKDNDMRFPDEMSISSKHARIHFRNDAFYLQDLGSKTGTYLRINKSMMLEDQTCIQFPPEVELVFRIIKKSAQEGIIKAEIKKPENFPDYKISLKEGFKIKIGRSEKCHIRINIPSIAEKHSEISYKNGEFYFKNFHTSLSSWHRLSPKAVRSDPIRLCKGDIFRLSSKKSFLVEQICNKIAKS